jgi:hypothetical protein
MESFVGRERVAPAPRLAVRQVEIQVYFSGRAGEDGAWCLTAGTRGSALSASIWTTRAGIEAIVEACQAALVRARIEQEKVGA